MKIPELLNRKGKRLVDLGRDGNFILQGIARPSVERRIYEQKRPEDNFSAWYGKRALGYFAKDMFFTFGFLALWTTVGQHVQLPDAADYAFSALTLKKFADACYDAAASAIHIYAPENNPWKI